MTEPLICQVPLHRTEKTYLAYLGILPPSYQTLSRQASTFLHPEELRDWYSFPGEGRKMSYLQGRFIAKQVLSRLLDESRLPQIQIVSGIFGQPLVSYPVAAQPLVSISHTHAYACALAVSMEHPMAVDMEAVSTEYISAVRSQLSTGEIWLKDGSGEAEAIFYTRLWTIKEAIAKVIHTGMMTPPEIFQVAEINRQDGYTISTFTNFAQYKALSFAYRENICSIVLPRNTACKLPLPLR